MNIVDFFRGAFRAAQEEGLKLEGVTDDATPETALASLIPADPRVAELEQQLATMQQQARKTAAVAFADTQISARKALPAERETLIALHMQAATDDAKDNGGRAKQVELLYSARPAHVLAGETVGHDTLIALAADAAKPSKDERKRQLLKLTQVGRTALKGEGK